MVNIGNDWDEVLKGEFEKDYYQRLRQFLIQEYRNYTVYPDMHDIFNALKYTAYKDVKVVILGQDPYHEPGQAHGLAFSVMPGVLQPPSLRNMLTELRDDLGLPLPGRYDGSLVRWAKSGVLLLNTSLTVREHQANSHSRKGWEILTDRIIELLNEREEPIVFILWGGNARKKVPLITGKQHCIIEGVHPSPLSANRGGFFGGKFYSRANEFLVANGIEPVDWSLVDSEE